MRIEEPVVPQRHHKRGEGREHSAGNQAAGHPAGFIRHCGEEEVQDNPGDCSQQEDDHDGGEDVPAVPTHQFAASIE